jgi:NAD(P)-dependent dehydrogenase (short-subunit alcohol dehydrogenase family)
MDVSGRTIVVTGSNTGIGRVTAEELARKGARVILACRSEEKTRPVIEGIRAAGGKAEFLALDLGDLDSVRRAAKTLLDRDEATDVLVNNAGQAALRGTTPQGFELAFGINHLGHYLFTRLLLPLLERSPAPRIVNVSSKSHYRAKGIDWEAVRKPTPHVTGLPEYEVSKLANVLFTNELARRFPKITSASLHPGVVASDAWRQAPWGIRHVMKLFMITNEQGAKTTLHCVLADDIKSGAYYDSSKERRPSRVSADAELSRMLWDKSAEWVGLPA